MKIYAMKSFDMYRLYEILLDSARYFEVIAERLDLSDRQHLVLSVRINTKASSLIANHLLTADDMLCGERVGINVEILARTGKCDERCKAAGRACVTEARSNLEYFRCNTIMDSL